MKNKKNRNININSRVVLIFITSEKRENNEDVCGRE